MRRLVESELLDELPADDSRAAQSREDLLKLNRWMLHAEIMSRALRSAIDGQAPRRMVELGAGDGRFLLRVARLLSPGWKGTTVTLLDRRAVVAAKTRDEFAELGWRTEVITADVFEWLKESAPHSCEAIVANLFLHHFSDAQLSELLGEAARRTRVFVAVEPRRSPVPLAFSRALGLVGFHPVTRHDAPASVRAGFRGRELSRLWPADENWRLREGPAGMFSHLFVAEQFQASLGKPGLILK